LWGGGKNGKSETVKAIARVMGDYAVNIAATTLMESKHTEGGRARPDILRLRGARFVTASEPGEQDVLSEQLIKSSTGDHAVTARPLYGKDIEFKPGAKIFLSTNHKPKIKGRDNGIWRRIWLFPFTVTISTDRQQRDYGDFLYEREGSGIFAWMLAGLRRYLEHGRLDKPSVVEAATAEYRVEMNPVGRFIKEMCVVDPRVRVGMTDLYDGYKTWCEVVNWKPLTKIKFNEFVGTMFERERDMTRRYWVGIHRKTEAEIENEDTIFETQSGLGDHTGGEHDNHDNLSLNFPSSRMKKVGSNLSCLSCPPHVMGEPTQDTEPREAATHSTDPTDYQTLPRPDFGQHCAACGKQGVLHREKPADFNRRRGTAALCADCFDRLGGGAPLCGSTDEESHGEVHA
jgi:P4 family phage/plasmid primase-like protien